MDMPTAKAPFTAQQLDAVLSQVRSLAGTKDAIWSQLLSNLHTDASTLAEALLEWHGIATVDPTNEAFLKTIPALDGIDLSADAFVWTSFEGQTILLCILFRHQRK